ncbi:MAG: hypothetical protein GEV06_26150 [Luteitalea sp.]|nr:hypothetical protein [Luteitalea sp.]
MTRLAACERDATARLIASIAALDARRLYLTEGFSSLFEYCATVLHLSEHAAYDRITAARAARRFPVILVRLTDGSVTLTTVRLLAPHLTQANHEALLAEVRHCSKRDVEHIVARLHPQPDVPPSVRKLPTQAAAPRAADSTPAASAQPNEPQEPATPPPEPPSVDTSQTVRAASPGPPARPAVVAPIAPARYKVSFTVGAETYAKLRQAQDLLRHVVPDGDPAVIYDRALTALLTQLLKTKETDTARPSASTRMQQDRGASSRSRRIPAAVQRTVWQRDGGQCTFVSRSGRRCAARSWLEFHHVVPFAVGGEASIDNICLRCRAHNAYQAQRDFRPSGAMRAREAAPSYGATRVELVPARVRMKSWPYARWLDAH